MTPYFPLALGLFAPLLIALGLWLLLRATTVEVEDEAVILVEQFGKHVATLKDPGLAWLPSP